MAGQLRAISRPYRVVIGEHEEVTRRDFARAFEAGPYDALVAGRGWDVIEIVQAQPVDVLVVDAQMPDISALAMVRVLKELDLATPCVFTSYSFSREMLIEAMIADVYSVLEKPIDLQLLRTVVQGVLCRFYSS